MPTDTVFQVPPAPMPSRPRRRFRHLPLSPRHVAGGWPRSVGTMQAVRFAPPCSAGDLESICNWAGLSFAARAHPGLPARALRRLVGIAARNSGTNSYHHHGHFAHVVMAAGVLAAMAGVRGPDRALLVLAALVHDLDHQGRRGSRRLYWQEDRSARITCRVLLGRNGDARHAVRLGNMIRATALTADRARLLIIRSDRLARLLTDADIFASVMYDRGISIGMTAALKLEQRLAGTPEMLNAAFARTISRDGLQSVVASRLLDAVQADRAAARNVIRPAS